MLSRSVQRGWNNDLHTFLQSFGVDEHYLGALKDESKRHVAFWHSRTPPPEVIENGQKKAPFRAPLTQ